MGTSFNISSDGIDPGKIPRRTLRTGATIPGIGFGTFGSDHAPPARVAAAVKDAVSLGFRHIDCASVYGNEAQIGGVLEEILLSGLVRREELWITSKLWNDMHSRGDVLLSCAQTLRDLKLDYLDLYLVHWPFPNHHPPGCPVDARSPDAVSYLHERYMETWGQMERLVEAGLVRHIGTSNMTVPKLRLLLRDAYIRPACNEMELHPHFQQPELFNFVVENGICPVAYAPLGSPHRPERDTDPGDTVDMEDPVIAAIAARHDCHPADVCLKWAVRRGQVPIPFSTSRAHIAGNLRAAAFDPLTAAEMQQIGKIDKNCRLIKGQVFLWKENQHWENLWDVNGEITPP